MMFSQQKHERKKVCVHNLFPVKTQQPSKCDGDDKNIDEQQIEGKEPYGFIQMFFIHVFHNDHLELTGKKNNRQHG